MEWEQGHDCWLTGMLKDELPMLLLESARPIHGTEICVREQLGSYITHILSILTQLASSLVHDEHVHICTRGTSRLINIMMNDDLVGVLRRCSAIYAAALVIGLRRARWVSSGDAATSLLMISIQTPPQ